jgi:hypothetical protein
MRDDSSPTMCRIHPGPGKPASRNPPRRARLRGPAAAVGALLAALAAPVAGEASDRLEVGRFSSRTIEQGLPEDWQPLTFRRIERHTRYELVLDEGTAVVRATSEAAASGLVRKISIDPAEHAVVEWRWKVARPLEKGDVTKKSGDDYAARIYVAFEGEPARLSLWERAVYTALKLWYGEAPPLAALNYVWDARAPVGTIVPNPYTERVRMIVVESGEANAGRWIDERRDVAADYRAAFGEDPPRITAVAIMTDTDDTGESATAWYGDVTFRRRVPPRHEPSPTD